MHFSKTKHSKFNESGQLSVFYLFSFGWGTRELPVQPSESVGWIPSYPDAVPDEVLFYQSDGLLASRSPRALLPEDQERGYSPSVGVYRSVLSPHRRSLHPQSESSGSGPAGVALLVELSLPRVRLVYFSNERRQTGFTIWAVLFVLGRLLTLSLSVLTVGFGLSNADQQGLDLVNGNFNVLLVRIAVLATICVTQAFMMWKFINFQLRRWREQAQPQAQALKPKKLQAPKTKSKKDKANGVNGVSSNGADSPRAKKEKSS
ncbi:translocating chain-associated membrane protein 1-like 1 [Salvelinus sp. IW2-2015]|uniref:translocating chain-associated membrane protein 1-like 1 n=1 Tax=Salvelinus sp. IW2-2015 TaxID=2691554 RepID=UPI0038D4BFE2